VRPAGSCDPREDVVFVDQEFELWLHGIIMKDWPRIARTAEAGLGKLSAMRAKAGTGRTGGEGNLAKLAMSDMLRLNRDIGNAIIGSDGMIMGLDTKSMGMVQEMTLFSPGPSIYGGSDQIQRNIIGERVLGLPKEPGPDKDTPFRELLVGTQKKA